MATFPFISQQVSLEKKKPSPSICEPLFNCWLQVLAYAQQSRECSNYEQDSLYERMKEYIRQIARESKNSLNGSYGSPKGDSIIRPFGRNSNKEIEAAMQSAAKGKVVFII